MICVWSMNFFWLMRSIFLFMNYFCLGSEINNQPVIDVKPVEVGSQTSNPNIAATP